MVHTRSLSSALLGLTFLLASPAPELAWAQSGDGLLFVEGFESGELCALAWSGVVNREQCDGVDNDCDLEVDEGGPLCFTTGPCLAAVCAGASGCVEVVAAGSACDDGDACTAADTCSSLGACVGDPLSCPAGAGCSPFGGCACDAAGLELCPDGCFDLATDPAHCGDCDVACTSGQACVAGQCTDLEPFEIDPLGAASAVIGAAGGELQVVSGGALVRVVVPAGALLDDTLINATPVSSFPLGGFANGVHLEPEGLAFFAPVEVEVTGAASFAFGYDAAAEDVHLRPATGAAGTITATVIELWHFSGVGTGEGPLPPTTPTSPEAQAFDALGRNDPAAAQAPLLAQWTSVEAALAAATTDRAAFDAAAKAFNSWRGLVDVAGLLDELAAQLASGEASLEAGLVAERDRLIGAAIGSGNWEPLLELETWLLPRAQVLGLADDGSPVSAAALNAMLPMAVSLSGVDLVYNAGDQRYHLVGQASTSLNGGPPITNPPVQVNASVFGSIEVSFQGFANGDAFDFAVTQSREHLSGTVVASFSGFQVLSVVASTTVAADNEAPLAVEIVADPDSFVVGGGSNLTVTVLRGFGPLGLAGTVSLSLFGDTAGCTLGSSGGIPDAAGEVHATVTCSAAGQVTVLAAASHRTDSASDDVFVQSTPDCSDAPPYQPGDTCIITDTETCACFALSCPEGTDLCCGMNICECDPFCN